MTSAARAHFPLAAVITYLVTLGAVFAASLFTEYRLWGLNWYGYFDWPVWLALAVAVLIAPMVMLGWRRDHDLPDTPPASGRSLFPLLAFLIVIAAGGAFYVFRCQTHFLGDGYQLLKWLQTGVHLKPWEKGTFLAQSWVFELLGGDTADALPALQLISYSAGLLLLLGASIVAARLFSPLGKRLLFVLGVASGGYMLLFFGYLESYPLFVCSVGWFCLVGLLVSRVQASRWLLLLPLALAGFFHIFAVALIPAACYLLFRDSSVGNRLAQLKRTTVIMLLGTVILVGLAVFFYLYLNSYFFRFTIVPLWIDQHTVEGYWLFSVEHLLDYANQLFLLLPAMLILIVMLFTRSVRVRLRRPDGLFLLSVLGPSLALAFLLNPGLGMPRDWDLFSFAGMPLVILFYDLLLDRDGPRGGTRTAILGVALGLLMLGPRVATQIDPAKSIALFDTYAALDRTKNSSGRFVLREYLKEQGREEEAEQRRQVDNEILPEGEWVATAHQFIVDGRLVPGVALLRKALQSDPSRYMAWANLGSAYAAAGRYDSALILLEIADARMPFNAAIIANLGGVYYAMEDFDRAEQIWLEALELNPRDIVIKRQLLELYERRQRAAPYRALLFEITANRDAPVDLLMLAANVKIAENDFATANWILRKALEAGCDTALVCEMQTQYLELKVLDCSF